MANYFSRLGRSALLIGSICSAAIFAADVPSATLPSVSVPATTPSPTPVATDVAAQANEADEAAPSNKPPIPHFGVEVTLNRTAVTVGETVVATVTYRWPATATVVSPDGEPDPSRDFAQAFVTELPPPQRFSSGQEERRIFTITMAARWNGAWELPRPTLTIRQKDGTTSTVASPVYVQVGKDSAPPALPPPRPIWTRTKAPVDTPSAWWIAAIVAVILIGIAALFFVRRRTIIIQQTPWDRFYDDWQAASSAADGKEVGARLSLSLRRCLGTVFRFDGPASTAKEAITFLRSRLQDNEHRDLAKMLDQLDALRWAADDLPASAVQPLLASGRSWTSALKKRLDAEAEAAKQAKQAKDKPATPSTSTATTSTL